MFKEIAGTAARYVDPMDVEGWRHAIGDAIDAGPERLRHDSPPDLKRFFLARERGDDVGFVSPSSQKRLGCDKDYGSARFPDGAFHVVRQLDL